MSVALNCFSNVDDHNRAWELAKQKAGVTDVRDLSREQFSDLCQLAELIRRGEVNVENL